MTRLSGIALFLPVPAVLWLFTQTPLGVGWSLTLGIAVMVTHRLYARPFARRHAATRCLWSGASIAGGPEIEVVEPLGTTTWRARDARAEESVRRVLGWAADHAWFLKVGILGPLLVLLIGGPLAAHGHLGGLTFADAVAVFRGGIALTVLPLGWLAARTGARDRAPLAPPFPVHIQALIGTYSVTWLFRIIGLVWLLLAARHLSGRL